MFRFCKKYDKIEIFQKSFFWAQKQKNAPLNKQCNAACPEGRNFISTYLKLLSEQIFLPLEDTDDKELMYAPFQCIAQYFLSKGYVGIKYKSTVCTGSKDLVLFDKTIASPIGAIKDFVIWWVCCKVAQVHISLHSLSGFNNRSFREFIVLHS